ncbi:hypothetical protein DPMN_063587 [Dreissena polymorpha]|uniref:Uncharacterized protein n=1 Tax=Dreissena polymorpha TaxID=45954 RepID=A0A9D4CAT3_DREPO|nr:hypothetical protein DPMN_063587 [Dreissena polymorpha]
MPLPALDPLKVLQTPAVLISVSQNLLKGHKPYSSRDICHLSHICRSVSILNLDTQVGRVSFHQQPIRRNPSDDRLLHFIKACSKTSDA